MSKGKRAAVFIFIIAVIMGGANISEHLHLAYGVSAEWIFIIGMIASDIMDFGVKLIKAKHSWKKTPAKRLKDSIDKHH